MSNKLGGLYSHTEEDLANYPVLSLPKGLAQIWAFDRIVARCAREAGFGVRRSVQFSYDTFSTFNLSLMPVPGKPERRLYLEYKFIPRGSRQSVSSIVSFNSCIGFYYGPDAGHEFVAKVHTRWKGFLNSTDEFENIGS